MNENIKAQVYGKLEELGISVRKASHAPAHTIEDCAEVDKQLGAITCKNYFLTTKSRKHYCLCVVRPNARLKTSDLSKQAGTPRLSFADGEEMEQMVACRPGSLSPMGLMFDPENRVRLLVDSALPEMGMLAFHPCDNTETLAMQAEDFFGRFLPAVAHSPEFVEIHDFLDCDEQF